MRKILALLPLLLLASCSSGTTPNTSNASFVYLMSGTTGDWQLSSYSANDTGDPAAAHTIAASTDSTVTGLEVSSDGNGNLYTLTSVPTGSDFTVSEYSMTSGVLSPTRSFVAGGRIGAFVADRSGVVYVVQNGDTVASFAANANGAVGSTQNYLISSGISIESLAEDSNGHIYVGFTSSGGDEIVEEFPADFSSLTPIKTIDLSAYLTAVTSLAVDSNGTLYVAGVAGLGIFGSPAHPQVFGVLAYEGSSLTPTRTLSNNYQNNIIGQTLNSIAVDSNNLLYVYSYVCPAACTNTVAIFNTSATGDVAPVNYFQIAGPLLTYPSMAVH